MSGENGVRKGFATNRLVSVRMEPRETLPAPYAGVVVMKPMRIPLDWPPPSLPR